MKKMGYIGKSFALGSLGILGSIIAACGGGGITDVGATASSSPFVLFASQYKEVPGAANELKAQTFEGGYVYANSGGAFKWGQYSDGTWSNANMMARQAFGIKWWQDGQSLNNTDFAYQAIKAPRNGSLNVFQSNKLVIQMGNGSMNQYDANSKKVFRVVIQGGEQNTSDYSYAYSCYFDKTLDPAAISDSGLAGAHPFGLRTYEIALADFTCPTANTLPALKVDVKEVVVKLIGGIDSATDGTTGAYTYLQTGLIAFSQ